MPRSVRLLVLASLLLMPLGCGGKEQTDEAIVIQPDASKVQTVPEPTPAPAPEPTPAEPTPAPAPEPEPTPSGEDQADAEPGGWGTLRGRVVFDGDPPAPEILVTQGQGVPNAEICSASAIPSEKLVIDPETKGVRWALVYILKPTDVHPEAESAARSARVSFDQKGCTFVPHVLAAMKGSTIEVRSSDQVSHNVHSYVRNLELNRAIAPGDKFDVPVDVATNRPGSVACDVHPWMKAWWLTLDTPYFAITDEQGDFEIPNVPSGTQQVVVWAEATHPGFVTSSATGDPIAVPAGGTIEQTFVLRPDQLR